VAKKKTQTKKVTRENAAQRARTKQGDKFIQLAAKHFKIFKQYREAHLQYLEQLEKILKGWKNKPLSKTKIKELMKNEKDNFNDTVIKDMEKFLNKKNTLKQLIKKIKGGK
tara:strand:- start:671 stop:1003 length:333 start_codon:yes stop_codon:yes gene_type:complete